MSSKNGNSILAILAGTAIGVGLGILFAPDKGSKTREKIKEGFDDLKREAKTKWDALEEDTKEKFSKTKEELKETVEGEDSQKTASNDTLTIAQINK
jgi:gas vesicle protein